jgi:hypothetical protein
LNTFCNSHFEEKNDFICVTKKGLLLNNIDFGINGYKVNERRFPQNLDKATLVSGKGKEKVNDPIDLSNDNLDDKMYS